MPRFPIWSCLPLVLPAVLLAQQPERYRLAGNDAAIYNLIGTVRIEAGSGEGVGVQLTRVGGGAARLRVAQGELDGRVTLRVLYPDERLRWRGDGGHNSTQLRVREDGTFGDTGDADDGDDRHHGGHARHDREDGRRVTISSQDGLDASADMVIEVPRGRRVAVYLAVGSVAMTNVDGELSVDTQAAPVTASGVKGRLAIDVGSGDVRVTQAEGGLSIDTGSGDVTGSELTSEELSIETGSGEIRLAGVAAPRLSLETGSGGVTVELREDVTSLQVEAGSGDIAIRAPATLGAAVEIETSSGDIETDFALQVTRSGQNHMVGTIGDGKGAIALETGSGQIRLLKTSK